MAITYKERSTYERKVEIEGSERIVVDETHYIDPDQIIEKAAETFPSQDDLEAVVERVETIEDSMYEKPSGGIPKSDLSEGVQESLEKADSALQEHQSLAAYRTAEAQDEIDAELSDAISGEQSRAGEAEQQLAARCTEIEGKIPNQATSANQLADKAFVNSSIATNTANYISDDGQPFTSPSALPTTGVTNNDYAFVTGTDEAGNTYYDRYKATVSGSSVTWAKEYRLNNSGFTAAQWAAIGSGITAVLTAKLSELPTAEALALLFADKQDVISDLVAIRSGAAAGATALQPEDIAISLTPSSTNEETAGAKAAYDAIFPTPVTSMPADGFKADTLYDIGELTGNINFLLADGVAGKRYCWAFATPYTLPAVAFPSGIKWSNDASHAEVMPELASSMRYEVSIVDGYALISEFDLISEDE